VPAFQAQSSEFKIQIYPPKKERISKESQTWLPKSVISTLGMLRQKNCKFEANLGNIGRLSQKIKIQKPNQPTNKNPK
jgi:hypothetical protein